jgi:hypothetical protein
MAAPEVAFVYRGSAPRGYWRPGQSYDMIGFRVIVGE